MKHSLSAEWQELIEKHEKVAHTRKKANARQSFFSLFILGFVLLAACAAIALLVHVI